MPSSTVNICVLTLVLLSLQQICQCRPRDRNRRGLVKDYFVPDTLIFSSDKFEKGEDGKFHLKKSAHRKDSEVNYSPAGNNVVVENAKISNVDVIEDDGKTDQTESAKNELIEGQLIEGVKETTQVPSEIKKGETIEQRSNVKSSVLIEDTVKRTETDSKKAPFTPTTDPEPEVSLKPDSKDEVTLKIDLPRLESEEKVDEKITIGQVPDLYSRLMPVPGNVRIPILIPIRHISFGAVKVTPLAPADISDRLPVPYDDDIVGEGAHESESEVVSEPLAEEKKDGGGHLGNPLEMGLPLSLLSFRSFLKDLKETEPKNAEKDSKVVDVMGKKFLMQSNVMKFPTGDNSRMFLRFLSVKPLEDVKPLVPEERTAGETLVIELGGAEGKKIEMKNEEFGAKEREILKKEGSPVASGIKEEIAIDSKMKKEMEIGSEIMKKGSTIESEMKEESAIDSEMKKEMAIDSEIKREMAIDSEIKKEMAIDSKVMKEESSIESEMKKEMAIESQMKEEKERVLMKDEEILKAEEAQIKVQVEKDVPKEVLLKMGEPKMEETMEKTGKEMAMEGSPEEAESRKLKYSIAREDDYYPVDETQEDVYSEKDYDSAEKEAEFESKEVDEGKRGKKLSAEEKKRAAARAILEKEAEAQIRKQNKGKQVSTREKKRKEISEEEPAEEKTKKKNERKKKKCGCSGQYSDSEDDKSD